MSRNKQKLYEGKAKILFAGPEDGTIIQYFKDDATAFNNKKKASIEGKGVLNNRISELIMTHLTDIGVPNHFIKSLSLREQLVRKVDIIPLEVIVRNKAAGSLCKRFGIEEGRALPRPVIEFCVKNDELGDPPCSEEHVVAFDWADIYELEEMKIQSLRINDFMSGLFVGIGIELVDFKIEFGRFVDEHGRLSILLADEISPDSCRLWDKSSGEKLDKDRFRQDLGGVSEAYQEIARRLGVLPDDADSAEIVELPKK